MVKPMKTALPIVGSSALAVGAYALLLRPRMLTAGATRKELLQKFEGADVVPGSKLGSVMATTIDAPPSAIWPWLVQMGFDRAGWYSWDLLDHAGIPSAQELEPRWQSIAVGQRLLATRNGKHWFEVAAVEPERYLALRVATSRGVQYDSSTPRPPSFSDTAWTFQLEPLTSQRTRLTVRTYSASSRRWATALAGLLFWEPAHLIMQRRQFENLRRRATATSRELSEARPLPVGLDRPGSMTTR
jgi:hypothetical protein